VAPRSLPRGGLGALVVGLRADQEVVDAALVFQPPEADLRLFRVGTQRRAVCVAEGEIWGEDVAKQARAGHLDDARSRNRDAEPSLAGRARLVLLHLEFGLDRSAIAGGQDQFDRGPWLRVEWHHEGRLAAVDGLEQASGLDCLHFGGRNESLLRKITL